MASILRGRPRSFHADAGQIVARLGVPLEIAGAEHIPRCGPGVLVVNHFSYPGFGGLWIAAAVSAAVPVDMHWLMAQAWTHPHPLVDPLYRRVTAFAFTRVARAYGFTPMPPMPPRPSEQTARALSLRRLLSFARHNPQTLVALAPEGGDHPGGVLAWPPSGAGRLIGQLASLGRPIYPAGLYIQSGVMRLIFGPPFELNAGLPPTQDRSTADLILAARVMTPIACLLPPELRGPFA